MGVLKLNIELLLAAPFKRNRILVFITHWMAWLLLHFIVFLPTLLSLTKIVWSSFFFTHFVLVSCNFLLFYGVAFYVMPLMGNFKKRWFWVLIASMIITILFTYLKFRLEYYHLQSSMDAWLSEFRRNTPPESNGFFSYRFRSYFQFNILTNVSIVILAFAYRLLLIWFQQEKIRANLENQKLRAELSFLKMQVNPHFLFNALNNIYSLATIEGSERTGGSILKLSELIRYMLYEKEDSESKVSLDREIQHINSYIDLVKLRYLDDINVSFSLEGETAGKRIAPLLLFPLIENAFKHGILTDRSKPVNIEVKVCARQLKFSICNHNNSFQKDSVGGIGLENVTKRLNLIYGDRYKLDIRNDGERFIVNLELPL